MDILRSKLTSLIPSDLNGWNTKNVFTSTITTPQYYNRTIYTTISGTSYNGNYLQLKIYSISFYLRENFENRTHYSYLIAESYDGNTWTFYFLPRTIQIPVL
jgi:hypothetical protein